MMEDKKVLKIKLPKKFTDEKIISEYAKATGAEPWEIRCDFGQIEAAVSHIYQMIGPIKLRNMLLTYFFAGLHFARTHKKSEYEYKFVTPEEKKKMEVEHHDTTYLG